MPKTCPLPPRRSFTKFANKVYRILIAFYYGISRGLCAACSPSLKNRWNGKGHTLTVRAIISNRFCCTVYFSFFVVCWQHRHVNNFPDEAIRQNQAANFCKDIGKCASSLEKETNHSVILSNSCVYECWASISTNVTDLLYNLILNLRPKRWQSTLRHLILGTNHRSDGIRKFRVHQRADVTWAYYSIHFGFTPINLAITWLDYACCLITLSIWMWKKDRRSNNELNNS